MTEDLGFLVSSAAGEGLQAGRPLHADGWHSKVSARPIGPSEDLLPERWWQHCQRSSGKQFPAASHR